MSNIFNIDGDLKKPVIFLCNKSLKRIGELTYFVQNINANNNFNNADEVSFNIYKKINDIENPLWDEVQNLRLIYIYDYDEYYEIELSEKDSTESIKAITGTSLCEAELSQLNIELEVNTDDDISRDDYEPTIIYNSDNPKASLLHRILKDKASHYTIDHVDDSLAKLQRTFSIDTNIDDFLRQELSEEIDAYISYNTTNRSISLYDMLSICNDCGYRGDFHDECPKCKSKNVKNGYGSWTNVYISKDNLADDIELSSDTSTIKNTFKLVGGDDTFTNLIPMVNPNGSGYIVKFSDLQYSDMPTELVDKLKSYSALCDSKKSEYKELMLNICKCLDDISYYQDSMMPSPELLETSSKKEVENVTSELEKLMSNKEPPNSIGINTFDKYTTTSLVNNAITSYVKILLSPGYKVTIKSSDYTFHDTYGTWTGIIHIESTSDEDNQYDSNTITLKVDGDAISYVTQKIDKALATKDLKDQVYDYSLYSVNELQSFIDAYESCESILIDHGDSEKDKDTPQYKIYEKYRGLKEQAIIEQNRKKEIVNDLNNKYNDYLAQQKIINDALNLQNYLRDNLYKLYCCYRRDDKYENSNYISDGLSDSEILKNIEKFIEVADKDLSIACQNQYTLSSTLSNLFLMKEFEPFHNKCKLGNWIYFEVNGNVYTLRLTKIGIDYDSLEKVTVEFSNVSKIFTVSNKISDILKDAQSISASYPSTAKQVSEDSKTVNKVNNWVNDGLNATNMMIANSPLQTTLLDHTGIWCRGYDDITGDYEPTQIRIVNSTLAVTDDNWETTKAAIGKFILKDPVTGEYKTSMGVIGETIVGHILLGENLGIYNNNQSLTFDNDGLKVSNGKNTFSVNPNNNELLALSNEGGKILYVDSNGKLHVIGDGIGIDITKNDSITSINADVNGLRTDVSNKVDSTTFEQTASSLNLAIKSKVDTDKLIAQINASKEGIKILGEKVDITGSVTFNSFSSDLQSSINIISSNASDAKNKTDGLANGTTVINGGCIQTNTIDANKIKTGSLVVGDNVSINSNGEATIKGIVNANYINTLGIKAGSVDAENITGNTISGKTIKGSKMSGCSGDFTSIFLYDKDKTGDFQHGSICGQYVDTNGNVTQTEVIRINNSPNDAYMYTYKPMYFTYGSGELIVHATNGIRFGSFTNADRSSTLPAYINTLDTHSMSGTAGIRLGFSDINDIPGFEVYDEYNINSHSHNVSAKVFGNLVVNGTIADQSSQKYKTNIFNMSDETALNLLKYNIVTFDYLDGRRGRHGMIAEDAIKVSDYGIVFDANGSPDAIGYINFIPDIIKLNQIMYEEIRKLKEQIAHE